MSLLSDEHRRWIGHEDPPVTVEVSRRDIVKYALATEQRLEKYLRGDEAPPMFVFNLFGALRPLEELRPDGLPRGGSAGPTLPLKRVMAGGTELIQHRPIRPGDRLTATTRLTDLYEKVGTQGAAHLQRALDACGRRERRSSARRDPDRDREVSVALRFGDLRVGDELPARAHTPTNVSLFLYNAAVWNPHRIHYDAAYTTQVEKHPGIVIDGPLQGDWLAQCVTNWLGDDGELVRFGYSNRRAAHLGETLTSGGRIAALDAGARTATLELFVKNERGEVTSPGTASVRLRA